MSKQRWIWVGLIAVLAIGSIYVMNNPGLSQRYAEMQREAQLSAEMKDVAMGLIAAAIIGYLGWFFLLRKE